MLGKYPSVTHRGKAIPSPGTYGLPSLLPALAQRGWTLGLGVRRSRTKGREERRGDWPPAWPGEEPQDYYSLFSWGPVLGGTHCRGLCTSVFPGKALEVGSLQVSGVGMQSVQEGPVTEHSCSCVSGFSHRPHARSEVILKVVGY